MNKFYDVLNCDIAKNKDILSRFNKKDQITNWLSNKIINFSNGKKLILKYSNKRTITGRINCVDKRFNPQLLPKNSEIRKEIVSEFNKGQIAIFDYVSFETKLSVYLTKNEIFIEKLKNSDLHLETSKIIFGKSDITPEQRKIGKQINHAIIYGVGNDKLKSILQENKLSIKLIDKIKEFLKPINDNSKKLSENFKEKGFIINPYNTIVYPNKEWAVYNNYVQSIAADMVVDKLFKIKELLSDKKSQFMYQVFDSFVFDIHPEELYLLENIKNILEKNGKYNFDIQYITGKNLMECTEQIIEEEIDFIN
jgi:DNA polymerase-1